MNSIGITVGSLIPTNILIVSEQETFAIKQNE